MAMTEQEVGPKISSVARSLLRWFLVSGSVGTIVALILGGLGLIGMGMGSFLFLWPSWSIFLADEPGLFAKFAFAFVGQFFLYGILGLTVATCVHAIRWILVIRKSSKEQI
jgi:hypothetical protein